MVIISVYELDRLGSMVFMVNSKRCAPASNTLIQYLMYCPNALVETFEAVYNSGYQLDYNLGIPMLILLSPSIESIFIISYLFFSSETE